jgi:hypothetical protein
MIEHVLLYMIPSNSEESFISMFAARENGPLASKLGSHSHYNFVHEIIKYKVKKLKENEESLVQERTSLVRKMTNSSVEEEDDGKKNDYESRTFAPPLITPETQSDSLDPTQIVHHGMEMEAEIDDDEKKLKEMNSSLRREIRIRETIEEERNMLLSTINKMTSDGDHDDGIIVMRSEDVQELVQASWEKAFLGEQFVKTRQLKKLKLSTSKTKAVKSVIEECARALQEKFLQEREWTVQQSE